ncbi:DNA helicase PIF1, ATP-dependent [Tanacetum coccineum]
MWQYLVDAFTAVEDQRLKWTRNNQDTLHVDLYHNLCDAVTRGDTSAAGLGKRIVFPRSFIGNPRYMMQNYQDAMALCRAYGNPDLFITFTFNPKWAEISEMLAHVPGQKSHDRPEIGTQLEKCFKCMTPDEINDIISAEIPSPAEDPEGYKVFLAGTIIDEDGYPIYRRRDNKVTAIKGKFTYDNQHVVPYNRYLLLKYHAHINVEWCNRSKAIKYLFKYLNKGPDRANIVIHDNVMAEADGASVQISQATCFAYGLLNDDKEWTHAIAEAKFWAIRPQLRDLFITILLFYDVSRPLQLWEENWAALSEDILHKKEFQDIPRLNPGLLTNLDNRLIRETLEFDVNKRYASLLLPGGRTVHSRFVIPLELVENNTCGIKQNTHLAELMQQLKLIIWDETPMT